LKYLMLFEEERWRRIEQQRTARFAPTAYAVDRPTLIGGLILSPGAYAEIPWAGLTANSSLPASLALAPAGAFFFTDPAATRCAIVQHLIKEVPHRPGDAAGIPRPRNV